MSRFRNATTNAVVNVDDSKDGRYTPGRGWEPADKPAPAAKKAAPAKKTASKK